MTLHLQRFQKNTEIILKEVKFIKDGEIDETEVGKFIDMTVEDEDWKPVLKAVVKECRNSVKARLPEIIKRARAEQKKECNVEWEPFVVCVVVQAFQVFNNISNSPELYQMSF